MKTRTRTFTKQQLCIVFGLHSKTYKTYYYKRLREEYFTNEVLEQIGMTREDYNQVYRNRHFTFMQSKRIIDIFQIEKEELEELCG